ncbi:hypothetical protein GCK72_007250 [Caenorhabditis remanei]|uniref:DUF38 domain-containing protein n=1 Tax=Caenorhabditis remanei TaxID=31234 RepID=A0A6A5HJK5_CAERE|nr:hypothetical protein GCK72_007250 [Caenorhabditis remanei]KAF1767291.1 hypothetical protein GCK72_007250 [Caenorhabditis remanei]
MPPGLTYPSLKCVFEFLEANKRQTRRGYFPIFYQKNGTGNTGYEYANRRGEIFKRRINKDYHNAYVLIRQLLESLLVGRRAIIVQKLVTGWLQPESENLELKFNVLEIESDGYDLKDVVPLIEPTSFPLKKFTQKQFSYSCFEHSEVRTANHLVITTIYINLSDAINILKSLNCKCIEIKDLLFNKNYVLDIIQMLLENHRDVETCYMMDILVFKSNTSNLMERMKERFKGRDVDFMDADKRSTLTSQYASIPIDSRTELAVYRNESLKERQEVIIMEMILTGHTPKVFRLDYSKLSESSEKREESEPENESREDESLDNDQSNLDKTVAEKFKMSTTSLPITYILIVVLFAWFFFF